MRIGLEDVHRRTSIIVKVGELNRVSNKYLIPVL